MGSNGFRRPITMVLGTAVLFLVGTGAAWLETRPDLATAWKTVALASGLTLEAPRGWRVLSDPLADGIAAASGHDELLVVWQLPPQADEPGVALELLPGIAGRLWPDATWSAPKRVGPSSYRCDGQTSTFHGALVVTRIADRRGTAWFAAFTTAPVARAGTNSHRFAHTLASLRLPAAS